ncbi:MAG: carbohydrate-binding family 9-like protein [Gemmatimonadota bacterium]
MDLPEPAPDQAPPRGVSWPLAAAALLLWALSTFGHGLGLDLVAGFFSWARQPGALLPEGGEAGFARGELLITLAFAGLATVVLAGLAWRLRRTPLPLLADAAAPWVLWGAMLALTWKSVILYATELVHFGQYALVGLLLSLALGRGRRPQLALVLAVGLGLLDEVWQHYGLHQWLMAERTHWMDWSDPILDALGAAGGILPLVTVQRLRPDPPPSELRVVGIALAAGAVLLLPLIFLDPVTTARWLGSYPYYPFWDEHINLKAVHWLRPHEGIPLLLVAVYVLGAALDPQSRRLSLRGVALAAVVLVLTVRPESRIQGRQVHEAVPQVQVPHLADLEAAAPVIDGRLEDNAWARAPRLGPFVENARGGALSPCAPEGRARPLAGTRARLLWDDEHLYLAFEVADADVWTRDLGADHGGVAGDEGLRVFVDDGGDEITYYEFDLNPANQLYDAFNLIPTAPLDYEPWSRQLGLAAWSARAVRSAVTARGRVDTVAGWGEIERSPAGAGYTAELAIPWETFRTTTAPAGNTIRRTPGPQPGDRWRLGLYRVERPRPLWDGSQVDDPVGAEEARAILGISAAQMAEDLAEERLRPLADSTGFSRRTLVNRLAQLCAENQAWSPTYRDFHQPARFGVAEFVRGG